ncbi:MAG: class I tRNA ligase family protein, partial [Thermobifida sp.]|nr:class I tRNA ligase family protein [Thermobifida sp.]
YEGDQPEKDADVAVTARYTGSQLEPVRYTPLWDYFADAEKWGTETSWQILVADYVTTGDGTGIVHQAPAYGEDDQKVCEGYGIPVILSLDEGAKFLNLFAEPTASGSTALAEIAGVQAFDANRTIINALKADDVLIREKSYVHSYPHCWRCRTPLIYRAITSWYVKVTDFKD